VDVALEKGAVTGVVLQNQEYVQARAVILTTGTFLQALMHVGEQREVGGRLGDAAATGISKSLQAMGFELARFKTGTPPRLRRDSIYYARCGPQPGGTGPKPLSLRTLRGMARRARVPRQKQKPFTLTLTPPPSPPDLP